MTFIVIVLVIIFLLAASNGGGNTRTKSDWHIRRSNSRDESKRRSGDYGDTECLKPDGSMDWHKWREDRRKFWDQHRENMLKRWED